MPGNHRREFGIGKAGSATCWQKKRSKRSSATRQRLHLHRRLHESTNDDDHFEVSEVVARTPSNNGVYDQPAWIYLKGGARVEADSATQSPAGVWYKRGSMSIFIDAARVDRIEVEDAATSLRRQERKQVVGAPDRPGLDSLIRQNGNKYNVDPYLIFLVMEQESHFNTHAVSPKGARGLMQLMPGTAARFGVRRPHDAAQNISGGTRYLRELLNRFNNRVDLVLASYNAGEGAVAKFGNRVPPYKETRNYVKKISYRYKRTIARTKKPAPEQRKIQRQITVHEGNSAFL